MTKSPMWIAGLVVLAAIGGFSAARMASSQDPPSAMQNQLDRLLQERCDVLRNRVRATKTMYQNARITVADVVHAENELLQAEIEMASTPKDRVKLLDQRLNNFKTLEKYAKERQRGGTMSAADSYQITAARLTAEIDLLREKMRPE